MLDVTIKKKLDRFSLNVSFTAEHETVALLGASGCGKSMTLKCIAGIETPDEGKIVLNGRVLFDSEKKINLAPQKRRVGYLFQQYALFPRMTAAQNIAAGVRTKDRAKRDAAVAAQIKSLRLEGLEDKRPQQLSGGQQQRVALARILANEPELLLLDEPFSALDDYLKWQLELELQDTLLSYGGTTVFVSHNRSEVYRLCGSVCVLSDGQSEAQSPVKRLFQAPATLSACLLSGCKNFTRIRPVDEARIEAVDWGVTLSTAGAWPAGVSFAGVRAHYLTPVREPGENTMLCRVERVIEDVFSTIVMLHTPGGSLGYSRLRMELDKKDWPAFRSRSELYVHINPEDIMLLQE